MTKWGMLIGSVLLIGFFLSLDFWGSGKRPCPVVQETKQQPKETQQEETVPSTQANVPQQQGGTTSFIFSSYSPLYKGRVIYYDPIRLYRFVTFATGASIWNYTPSGDFFAMFIPPWMTNPGWR